MQPTQKARQDDPGGPFRFDRARVSCQDEGAGAADSGSAGDDMANPSPFDFSADKTHCIRCGKPLRNYIRCRDCGRLTCSELCQQKHVCGPGQRRRARAGLIPVSAGCFLLLLVFGGCGGFLAFTIGTMPRGPAVKGPTHPTTEPKPAAQIHEPELMPREPGGPTVQRAPTGRPRKTVHVSDYTKKDGTHVQAHDRAAPGQGSKRR